MWSKHNPRLQKTWDATSLRALMQCPRKYYYSIVEGWRPQENSPHLTFGGLFQLGVEIFQLARLRGLPLEDAGREALKRVLQESGEYVEPYSLSSNPIPTYTWRPWGGEYVKQWRCTGTEPYKNEKGNRAKCPYSHAGKWFTGEPGIHHPCHECGSPLEERENYIPEHPTKNRHTLIRTLCAFFDDQHPTEGLQPYAFPMTVMACPHCKGRGEDAEAHACEKCGGTGDEWRDSTPAIELQVVVPLGRKVPVPLPDELTSCEQFVAAVKDALETGEDYIGVANLDEINTWRGVAFITDNKTTSRTLSKHWFQGFSPDVQFDFYDLVGSIAFPDLNIVGLAVRGVQVTQEDSRIDLALITKTEGQREEFWKELYWWLGQAERYAKDNYWPMNRASCERCDFRSICDTDPAFREGHLAERFMRRPWHPIHRDNPQKEESDEPA